MASFSVSPSPFNPVKLELGVWIVLIVPVWLVVHALTEQEWARLLLLSGYSSFAALRLLWRISRIQRLLREGKQQEDSRYDA